MLAVVYDMGNGIMPPPEVQKMLSKYSSYWVNLYDDYSVTNLVEKDVGFNEIRLPYAEELRYEPYAMSIRAIECWIAIGAKENMMIPYGGDIEIVNNEDFTFEKYQLFVHLFDVDQVLIGQDDTEAYRDEIKTSLGRVTGWFSSGAVEAGLIHNIPKHANMHWLMVFPCDYTFLTRPVIKLVLDQELDGQWLALTNCWNFKLYYKSVSIRSQMFDPIYTILRAEDI